jgi:hypothetical protein
MRRLQIVGLCVVAALALSAAVATSASATVPTWFECAKAPKVGKGHTGNYNDKLCTSFNSEGTGKYVLREGVGRIKTDKGKSEDVVLNVQTYLGDSTVECAKGGDRVTPLLPNRVVSVEVVLKKCVTHVGGGTKKCSSALRKAGEIKLHAMSGELGYISESPVVVGVKLGLESEPGGVIANFDCEGLEVTVAGEIIGLQEGDVNAVSRESETVFESGEYLGEVEYEGHKFSPLVNLLGFEDELEAIGKLEAPPNVLAATICGPIIEGVLGKPCAPEAYAGQNQTMVAKGEPLEIKTS